MSVVNVAMIVRNEMDRHLDRALSCAFDVAKETGGRLSITDDCSDDGTFEHMIEFFKDRDWKNQVVRFNRNLRPAFMKHEGQARQAHLDWVGEDVEEGDWVLSMDADETINSLDALKGAVDDAWTRDMAILIPLYEFWSETEFRTDGYWFGTRASRLFRWKDGGRIRDREFGCGSEPTYVADAVRSGNIHNQSELHLLHWGYVNPKDRLLKHGRYSKREGGHGHNSRHIKSIISANPVLKPYEGEMDW